MTDLSSALPRPHRLIAVLTVLVSLLLASAWLAGPSRADSAYPPSPGCSLSVGSSSSSGGVTVTGSGFAGGSTVGLGLTPGGTSLGSAKTDPNGSFTTTVTVPATSTGGDRYIVATSGSLNCRVPAFGTESVNAGPRGSGSSGSLASTGFATAGVGVLAFAFLGAGALLLIIGRRRRV